MLGRDLPTTASSIDGHVVSLSTASRTDILTTESIHLTISTTSRKDCQVVSLSTASSMDVQGVSIFHNQQNGRARLTISTASSMDVEGCRVPAFPPPAVWTWRGVGVYPLPPPAVWTRVRPFPLPAIWACRVCPFLQPAVWTKWTCREYPFSKCRNVGRSGIHSMPMPSCINDDLSNEPNFGRIISLDSSFKNGLQISL